MSKLNVSVGVKEKKIFKNQTYFLKIFANFQNMSANKPIFEIKARNFQKFKRAIESSTAFSKLPTSEFQLHNGWIQSQSTNKTKRGLCINKEEYAEIKLLLTEMCSYAQVQKQPLEELIVVA